MQLLVVLKFYKVKAIKKNNIAKSPQGSDNGEKRET